MQARTFHSAAHRQLSYFWPSVFGGQMPRLAASKISLVAGAAGRMGLKVSGTELRDLSSEIEWAAACLGSHPRRIQPRPSAPPDRQPPVEPGPVMAKLMDAYSEAKRQAEVLDFDDLLLLTAAAIEGLSSVAGKLRQQYRHFVVDEYQDVTPLQQRLLDAWLGDGESLCVVGDPQQTIYSFTGASAIVPGGVRGRVTRRRPWWSWSGITGPRLRWSDLAELPSRLNQAGRPGRPGHAGALPGRAAT